MMKAMRVMKVMRVTILATSDLATYFLQLNRHERDKHPLGMQAEYDEILAAIVAGTLNMSTTSDEINESIDAARAVWLERGNGAPLRDVCDVVTVTTSRSATNRYSGIETATFRSELVFDARRKSELVFDARRKSDGESSTIIYDSDDDNACSALFLVCLRNGYMPHCCREHTWYDAPNNKCGDPEAFSLEIITRERIRGAYLGLDDLTPAVRAGDVNRVRAVIARARSATSARGGYLERESVREREIVRCVQRALIHARESQVAELLIAAGAVWQPRHYSNACRASLPELIKWALAQRYATGNALDEMADASLECIKLLRDAGAAWDNLFYFGPLLDDTHLATMQYVVESGGPQRGIVGTSGPQEEIGINRTKPHTALVAFFDEHNIPYEISAPEPQVGCCIM